MPRQPHSGADTIKILVSTDNHVGYAERDPVRGDDSWRSFDEVMTLARERDVDMVLLAGDLFHENKPSRKALYQVMRSLRTNCFGDKPCELQMLSDGGEHFAGAFNHVNYDDENLNVAIPVFSIHGNHDDPSGEGHLAALDILAMSGLLNYYGRTPEADNIEVKPVLLQKGQTKLALYGMSNVRDERLYRTFRDGKVKFFQPNSASGDWYNIMSVHQNHHAYTETSYLPEQFLPDFMDLIVWGHEHECKIEPTANVEMGFRVMQPGSSVATSLVKSESVPKHVAILSITGQEMECEPVRLKTVRPFVMDEIVMRDDPEMVRIAHKADNKPKVKRFLADKIEQLIARAEQDWLDALDRELEEGEEIPKPLIRLRVEVTPPEGGKWELENIQRFSNEFTDKVANTSDVIQFHKKKAPVRRTKVQADDPDENVMAQITIESIKVDELVQEFLTAQTLTILPQNRFSDAVGQFVDKDDKNAMTVFLKESLDSSKKSLLETGEEDDEDEHNLDDEQMFERLESHRMRLEEAHARGELKLRRHKGHLRPKPDGWDSDVQGHWEDNYGAIPVDGEGDDDEDDDDDASVALGARPARGRGSRGGRGGKTAAGTSRKTAAATKKAPAKTTTGRGKKKQIADGEDSDEDVVVIDDDDDDDDDDEDESQSQSQGLFVSQATQSRSQRAPAPAKKTAALKATATSTRGRGRGAAVTSSAGRQSQLNFGSGAGGSRANGTTGRSTAASSRPAAAKRTQLVEDDISDDDDAFEPAPATQRTSRTGHR